MANPLARALAGAAATLCALLAPAPALAQSELAIELHRDARIHVAATLAGRPADAIVDSGASVHLIDTAFAARLGLSGGRAGIARGLGGDVDGMFYDRQTLSLGGFTLTNQSFLAIDLGGLSRANGRAIELVLGRPLFEASRITFDFPGRTMTLDAAAPTSKPLALRDTGTMSLFKLRLDHGPAVPAVFDLGNPGTLSLSPELVDRLPELGNRPQGAALVSGVGGGALAKRVTLGHVALGSLDLAAVPAELVSARGTPFAGRANAGLGLFKSMRVTVDMAQGALWLEPVAAPTFERDRVGLSLIGSAVGAIVAMVSPGSPAAEAGLSVNDEIVAIDGQRASPAFLASAWSKGKAGSKVTLARADGSEVTLTLADYY